MLLTKGIEVSGYLDHAGRRILGRLRHERPLALFLVSAAAVLSTVLTNDIALFIVVPLTLGLRNVAALPVSRLIIFEALAVNAGSLLTPIGNPPEYLVMATIAFVVRRLYPANGAAGGGGVRRIAGVDLAGVSQRGN